MTHQIRCFKNKLYHFFKKVVTLYPLQLISQAIPWSKSNKRSYKTYLSNLSKTFWLGGIKKWRRAAEPKVFGESCINFFFGCHSRGFISPPAQPSTVSNRQSVKQRQNWAKVQPEVSRSRWRTASVASCHGLYWYSSSVFKLYVVQ